MLKTQNGGTLFWSSLFECTSEFIVCFCVFIWKSYTGAYPLCNQYCFLCPGGWEWKDHTSASGMPERRMWSWRIHGIPLWPTVLWQVLPHLCLQQARGQIDDVHLSACIVPVTFCLPEIKGEMLNCCVGIFHIDDVCGTLRLHSICVAGEIRVTSTGICRYEYSPIIS